VKASINPVNQTPASEQIIEQRWWLAKFQNTRRNRMPLIQLVIVLVVIGVILWAINTFIPMQRTMKKILNAVVIIGVIIWLLSVFGVIGDLSTMRIGN